VKLGGARSHPRARGLRRPSPLFLVMLCCLAVFLIRCINPELLLQPGQESAIHPAPHGSGRSSGVEHYLAKVRVVSSNLIARSNFPDRIQIVERRRGRALLLPQPRSPCQGSVREADKGRICLAATQQTVHFRTECRMSGRHLSCYELRLALRRYHLSPGVSLARAIAYVGVLSKKYAKGTETFCTLVPGAHCLEMLRRHVLANGSQCFPARRYAAE
jgi:hypothetical protein